MHPNASKAPGSSEWRSLIVEGGSDSDKYKEARAAQEELKNMLLASLQMQHLVILAGSGCSLAAGGPSMADLWNATVGKAPPKKTEEVAGKIHYDLGDQNIEALLSKAEALLQVETDNNVATFLSDSKRIILDKCSKFLDLENLDGHKTFLHRLSRRGARAPRLKVFTTNYDLCFERAAAELGTVVLDGFSFTAPRHHDPRFFSYDIVQRSSGGDGLGQYVPGVFQLYKLHGSVNWVRDENGSIYEKALPDPDKACLIYPASGKYQQSYTQPYLESIARYLAAVREPNTCLVVAGFGFNDNHLSEPLLTAIETNPHLRVIVADPDAQRNNEEGENAHWRRLFKLSADGEDVWFINAGFEDFAKMIPDLKSLTPTDNLVKAIKSVTRES